MGGSAGDTSKSTTKLPEWFESAAKKALGVGERVAQIGYVPYYGPDVAAFAPQAVRGMQGIEDWNAAFNTPGQAGADIASELMPATDFGNGLMGYSSGPGYDSAVASLRQKFPGKYL